jgi:hypothetical protein
MSWSQEHDRYLNHTNWHEALSLFPEMEEEDLRGLAADIRANGLLSPIVLAGTAVLDGRNRLLACKIADVEPTFVQWDLARGAEIASNTGSAAQEITRPSVVDWVISQNMARRHLTTSQRAVIALQAEKLLASEAKKRQATNTGGPTPQLVEKLPQAAQGKARDKAGKLLQVSGRYVQDAKKIAEKSPELIAEIKAGRLTVSKAKEQSKKKSRSGPAAVHQQPDLRVEVRSLTQHLRAAVEAINQIRGKSDKEWQEILFLTREGRPRRSKTSLELEELCRETVSKCLELFPPASQLAPKTVKELMAAIGPQLDAVFGGSPETDRQGRVNKLVSVINERYASAAAGPTGDAA